MYLHRSLKVPVWLADVLNACKAVLYIIWDARRQPRRPCASRYQTMCHADTNVSNQSYMLVIISSHPACQLTLFDRPFCPSFKAYIKEVALDQDQPKPCKQTCKHRDPRAKPAVAALHSRLGHNHLCSPSTLQILLHPRQIKPHNRSSTSGNDQACCAVAGGR